MVNTRYRRQLKPWIVSFIINEGKRKAHSVKVLRHLSGEPTSGCVKHVTDGEAYIRARFTAQAVQDFLHSIEEEDSPPDWSSALLILQDYSLQFVPNNKQELCEYELLVERYKLWDLQEGFGRKNTLTLCMEDPRVKQKSAEQWQTWMNKSLDQSVPLSQLLEELGQASIEQSSISSHQESATHKGSSHQESAFHKGSSHQESATHKGSSHQESATHKGSSHQESDTHSGSSSPQPSTSHPRNLAEECLKKHRKKSGKKDPSISAVLLESLVKVYADFSVKGFLISKIETKILDDIPEWKENYHPPSSFSSASEEGSYHVSAGATLAEEHNPRLLRSARLKAKKTVVSDKEENTMKKPSSGLSSPSSSPSNINTTGLCGSRGEKTEASGQVGGKGSSGKQLPTGIKADQKQGNSQTVGEEGLSVQSASSLESQIPAWQNELDSVHYSEDSTVESQDLSVVSDIGSPSAHSTQQDQHSIVRQGPAEGRAWDCPVQSCSPIQAQRRQTRNMTAASQSDVRKVHLKEKKSSEDIHTDLSGKTDISVSKSKEKKNQKLISVNSSTSDGHKVQTLSVKDGEDSSTVMQNVHLVESDTPSNEKGDHFTKPDTPKKSNTVKNMSESMHGVNSQHKDELLPGTLPFQVNFYPETQEFVPGAVSPTLSSSDSSFMLSPDVVGSSVPKVSLRSVSKAQEKLDTEMETKRLEQMRQPSGQIQTDKILEVLSSLSENKGQKEKPSDPKKYAVDSDKLGNDGSSSVTPREVNVKHAKYPTGNVEIHGEGSMQESSLQTEVNHKGDNTGSGEIHSDITTVTSATVHLKPDSKPGIIRKDSAVLTVPQTNTQEDEQETSCEVKSGPSRKRKGSDNDRNGTVGPDKKTSKMEYEENKKQKKRALESIENDTTEEIIIVSSSEMSSASSDKLEMKVGELKEGRIDQNKAKTSKTDRLNPAGVKDIKETIVKRQSRRKLNMQPGKPDEAAEQEVPDSHGVFDADGDDEFMNIDGYESDHVNGRPDKLRSFPDLDGKQMDKNSTPNQLSDGKCGQECEKLTVKSNRDKTCKTHMDNVKDTEASAEDVVTDTPPLKEFTTGKHGLCMKDIGHNQYRFFRRGIPPREKKGENAEDKLSSDKECGKRSVDMKKRRQLELKQERTEDENYAFGADVVDKGQKRNLDGKRSRSDDTQTKITPRLQPPGSGGRSSVELISTPEHLLPSHQPKKRRDPIAPSTGCSTWREYFERLDGRDTDLEKKLITMKFPVDLMNSVKKGYLEMLAETKT